MRILTYLEKRGGAGLVDEIRFVCGFCCCLTGAGEEENTYLGASGMYLANRGGA